jgi:hypothetical protein
LDDSSAKISFPYPENGRGYVTALISINYKNNFFDLDATFDGLIVSHLEFDFDKSFSYQS